MVVKERFKKVYRHPVLDERLTRERLSWEARCLSRCRRAGGDCPLLLFCDLPRARLYMERIHGVTVRQWLHSGPSPAAVAAVAVLVGRAIANLHTAAGMSHGDLTTSNMMLRGLVHPGVPVSQLEAAAEGRLPLPPAVMDAAEPALLAAAAAASGAHSSIRLALIDFGLAGLQASPEDKGVDLYVCERAITSAHADLEERCGFFAAILAAYYAATADPAAGGSAAAVAAVKVKYEAVRMRGRKRLAFG